MLFNPARTESYEDPFDVENFVISKIDGDEEEWVTSLGELRAQAYMELVKERLTKKELNLLMLRWFPKDIDTPTPVSFREISKKNRVYFTYNARKWKEVEGKLRKITISEVDRRLLVWERSGRCTQPR